MYKRWFAGALKKIRHRFCFKEIKNNRCPFGLLEDQKYKYILALQACKKARHGFGLRDN